MSQAKSYLLLLSLFLSSVYAVAANSVAVQPTSISYGSQYLNKEYSAVTINMKNTGSSAVSLSSYAISGPYRWRAGLAPQRFNPGATITLSIQFWPTTPGPTTGSIVLNFNGGVPSVTLPLSGTGQATSAAISYNTKELVFSAQPVGSSTSHNLVLTNTGHNTVTVDLPLITPGVFSLTSPTFPVTLLAGHSTTVVVSYAPVEAGTQLGTISFTFNSLPFSGVGLNGTATASTALTVATTSPILGSATQGAIYSYVLTAAGGAPPYSWRILSGSLPQGLTLTAQGVITGSVAKTASSSNFVAQVTDTNSNSASATIGLNVESTSPAHCSDISWNITGTSNPEIPMDTLGGGTYLGYEGGLYPGGSNAMPSAHQQFGINLAQAIQPLDANGKPSSSGKYVLLSLGTSDANYEFERFLEYASGESTINPNLVIVEGAMGNEALDTLLSPNGYLFWNNIYNWAFPEAKVTPQQVVAIWLEPEDAHPPGLFPQDMQQIHTELRTLIPNLLVRFPNLKLLYLSSRAYGGYANPAKTVNEPYSYDQGYALQAVLADQINGDPALNFDPSVGPVEAPWMAWENYKWGNGMTAHNGLVWACPDFRSDGYHVSGPGEDKVSGLLMNFLKSDPTAAPWFYAGSGAKH